MAAPDCLATLERLHTAILDLAAGARVTQVSFGERNVSYSPQQLKDLQAVYRSYYRLCGSGSGFPDLAATVERGPPAQSSY